MFVSKEDAKLLAQAHNREAFPTGKFWFTMIIWYAVWFLIGACYVG